MVRNILKKSKISKSVVALIFSSLVLVTLFQNCGKKLSADASPVSEETLVQIGASKLSFPESAEPMYLLGDTGINQEQFNEEAHKRQAHQLNSQSKSTSLLKGPSLWPSGRLGFVTTPQARKDLTENERGLLMTSLMQACQELNATSGVTCLDLDNASVMPVDTAIVWVSSEYRQDQSKICAAIDAVNPSSCASLGRNTMGHDGKKFGWVSVLKEDIDKSEVIVRLVEKLVGVNHDENNSNSQLKTMASGADILPVPRGAFVPRPPTGGCSGGDTRRSGAPDWCPDGYANAYEGYIFYRYTCNIKQGSRRGQWVLVESGFDVSACKKITDTPAPAPVQRPLPPSEPRVLPTPPSDPRPLPSPDSHPLPPPAPIANEPVGDKLPIPENAKPPLKVMTGECRQNDSSTQRNFMPCPVGYSGQGMPASVVYKFTCNKEAGSRQLRWVLSESYFDVSGCKRNVGN